MFNDERINYEMSKLKKIIIILSGILSFVFLIYKMYINYFQRLQLCLYIIEVVICLTSLIIVLGSFFIKTDIKDEMYFKKKQKYYDVSFKVFIYMMFVCYAVMIPEIVISDESDLSPNICINLIMTSSLFFGYGYLRSKRIYFNYNFIEENAKTYYKNVFKNILKIIKFFGMIYGIALIVSVFYMFKNSPLIFIVSILLGFLLTVLSNLFYYLFISFLERLFFKEDRNKKITTPTVCLLTIAGISLIVYTGLEFIYYLLANSDVNNHLSTITNIVKVKKVIIEYCRFFVTLGLIFLDCYIDILDYFIYNLYCS